jgi:hypothetical protein
VVKRVLRVGAVLWVARWAALQLAAALDRRRGA